MIPITEASVSVFTGPTEGPESDGTLEWTSTTIVIAEVKAGRIARLGYTYGDKSIATFIHGSLLPIVRGRDDHERIERTLFDGGPAFVDGMLRSDPSRPGFGRELKRADAARYAA